MHNLDSNIIAEKLYWGRNVDEFVNKYRNQFDVVIAADVIYEESQVVPLIETAVQILRGKRFNRDRHTDTDGQTDRQADRQTDRQTDTD